MTTLEAPPSSRRASSPSPRLLQALGAAVAALVLVQAFLAGRHLFAAWGITVHGVIGNVVFLLVAALVGLALWSRADRVTTTVAIALVLLVTTQIGLGYSGRESLTAAAWHVPNGVLTFGLAVLIAARPATRRA